jgi:4-hydroxy-tetrahydrodipicolinate reductase
MEIIKVAQFGLGTIGLECVRWILKKPTLEMVGAIDIDPDKVGKPLSSLLGMKKLSRILVSPDLGKALKNSKPDVVLHTTQSSLEKAFPQIETIVKAGINVVSSTEELLVPEHQHPLLAKKIDQLAKKYNVTVLGTGVNPGFVMDTLPLCLSSMCLEIESISVRRELDAGKRRLPLQKKVGSGLTPEEFMKLKKEKKIGHVGLVESLDMILKGLGWVPDVIEEILDPVVADRNLETEYLKIRKGQVCGIKHCARALRNGKEIVSLDLRMYVGAPESFDLVEIKGVPPIKAKFIGGIHGDHATVAALINAIPRVMSADPGLLTMREISLPTAFETLTV